MNIQCIFLIYLYSLRHYDPSVNLSYQMQALLRGWGKTLTWLFGLEIKIKGEIPQTNGILISNHRSYTDIPIIMGYKACVFLAKAELE